MILIIQIFGPNLPVFASCFFLRSRFSFNPRWNEI